MTPRLAPPVSIAILLAASGCGSDPIHGGKTTSPAEASKGRMRGVPLHVTDCRDAGGQPVPLAERAVVRLVETPEKKNVLVEDLTGYDSIVAKNSFSEGGDTVYQIVHESDDGLPLLREYRISGASGRLLVAARFSKTDRDEGFAARAEQPLYTCALGPKKALADDAPSTAAAPPEGSSAPAAPAEQPSRDPPPTSGPAPVPDATESVDKPR